MPRGRMPWFAMTPTRCPFCDAAPFAVRDAARDHVLAEHPDRVDERVARIVATTRAHMVNPRAWAAGVLLYE
jgi:hypothetical protein